MSKNREIKKSLYKIRLKVWFGVRSKKNWRQEESNPERGTQGSSVPFQKRREEDEKDSEEGGEKREKKMERISPVDPF